MTLRWIMGAVAVVTFYWVLVFFAGSSALNQFHWLWPYCVTESAGDGASGTTPNSTTAVPLSGKAFQLDQRAVDAGKEKTFHDSSLVNDDAGDDFVGRVYIIGEPVDPEDPSTWPPPENTEVFIIGEPVDPEDPSTWPPPENTEVFIIGDPVNPEDPSTWPPPENTEVFIIGDPVDPEDPIAWPTIGDEEVFIIGDPVDPQP